MSYKMVAVLVVVFCGGVLYAQNMPGGSYQKSCKDAWVERDTLHASCEDANGNMQQSSLDDFVDCGGDITNQNGRLACTTPERNRNDRHNVDWEDRWSHGSASKSCQNMERHGNMVMASCQSKDGSWHDTTLRHANKCQGDIVNDDGNLRCALGSNGWLGWNNGIPGGTYTQTCRNVTGNSDRLDAECQARDAKWRHTILLKNARCQGQIENDDGHLGCRTGAKTWIGSVGGIPGGSYLATCDEVSMDGDRLRAKCVGTDRHHHDAELRDPQSCVDIANMNGTLSCIR